MNDSQYRLNSYICIIVLARLELQEYYLCDLLGRTIATGECDANELKILEIPQMSGTLFMHIIESETQFSHTTCIYVE